MWDTSKSAPRGGFSRRLLSALVAAFLVAFAPSATWATSDDAAVTTSPTSSSSPGEPSPSPVGTPVDTSSSTQEPSPTPSEPEGPDETEDSAALVIDSEQWAEHVQLQWAMVIGLALVVLVGSAGVIASFGRSNHVS